MYKSKLPAKAKPAGALVLLPEALSLPHRNPRLFFSVAFLIVIPCYIASILAPKLNPFLLQLDITPLLPFLPSDGDVLPATRRLVLTLDPLDLLLSQLPAVALSGAAAAVIRFGNPPPSPAPSTSPWKLLTGLAGKWSGIATAVVLAQLATSVLGALFTLAVIYVGLISSAVGSLPTLLVSLAFHAAVAMLGVALLGLGLVCECGVVASVAEEDSRVGGAAALARGWDVVVEGGRRGKRGAADAAVIAMLFFLLDEACSSLSGAVGGGLAGAATAVAVQVVVQLLECCVLAVVYFDWKRRRSGIKEWDEEDLEFCYGCDSKC